MSSQICNFVSLAGKKCPNEGHNCEDWNGRYVGFCLWHYKEVKQFIYTENENEMEGRCMAILNRVSKDYKFEMKETPICKSKIFIHVIHEMTNTNKDVLCTFCPRCFVKRNTDMNVPLTETGVPSIETVKKYTTQYGEYLESLD